jgi:copper chaperone
MANTFKISGMTCNHCIKSIDEAIKQLSVEKYDVRMGSLYVEYNPEKLTKEQIVNAIEEAGYKVTN